MANNKLEDYLFETIKNDDVKKVYYILNLGANIKAKDAEEYEPIMYVKSKEMLNLLLESGADINFKSPLGNTLMMLVARRGDVELLKEIIKNNGDVGVKNYWGDDAIYNALVYDRYDAFKVLVDNGGEVNTIYKDISTGRDSYSILDKAILRKNFEAVKLLVEKGADVNLKVDGGWSPLVFAVETQYYPIVEYLIENGADVNSTTDIKETVLMHAINDNDEAKNIVYMLLEKGADLSKKDVYGLDIFYHAKLMECFELIDYVKFLENDKKCEKENNLLEIGRKMFKSCFLSNLVDR